MSATALQEPAKSQLLAIARAGRPISKSKLQEQAEADAALALGWNPFIHPRAPFFLKKPDPRAMAFSQGFVAINCMAENPAGWGAWLADRADALGSLERPASLRALGRCASSHQPDHLSFLAGLLLAGVSPDSPELPHILDAPLLAASAKAARLLVAAGADVSALGEKGESAWGAWALRAARQQIAFSELDWIESAGSPKTIGALRQRLAESALLKHPSREALRALAQRGVDAAAFGLDSPEGLQEALWRALASASSADALSRIALLVGWPSIFQAMDHASLASTDPDDADADPPPRVCSLMWLWGRVDCAAALRKNGWREDHSAERLALEALQEAGEDYASNTLGDSLAWLIRRFPPSGALSAQAIWSRAASWPMECAAPVARALSSRGWLPDAGPLSLGSLRESAPFWSAGHDDDLDQSFAELLAYCESRSLKKIARPSARAAKAPRRL